MGRLAQVQRYLGAFYLFNLLGLAAYLALRQRINWRGGLEQSHSYLKSPEQLWYWEKRAFWMLLALAAGRYVQRSTFDAYLAEILGYSKLCAAVLMSSADSRLGACLVICYLLIFLLLAPPRYGGPQSVEALTPASLHARVLNPAASPGKGVWLVMFSAPWSSACAQAEATFAGLSVDYASDQLQFGELDVGRWPKLASQFEVSTDAIPHQLPAFLLFKRGKVCKRLPEKGESWDRKGKLRDRLLREFDLDMVLASGLDS